MAAPRKPPAKTGKDAEKEQQAPDRAEKPKVTGRYANRMMSPNRMNGRYFTKD